MITWCVYAQILALPTQCFDDSARLRVSISKTMQVQNIVHLDDPKQMICAISCVLERVPIQFHAITTGMSSNWSVGYDGDNVPAT
jgi:hypothetical protein